MTATRNQRGSSAPPIMCASAVRPAALTTREIGYISRAARRIAGQPGYRSKLTYADADYFNLPANDARIAKTRRATPVPTLEQITHVLATMPSTTDVELRNRALVAFAILTGARDGALASLKLKHVDLAQNHVFQDGRAVATKRGN